MALSGSFAAAGCTQWAFEVGGLAIFLFALWRILRRRFQSVLRTTTCLAGAAAIAACGAWLNLPRGARVLLWIILIAASVWLARSAHSRKCACPARRLAFRRTIAATPPTDS
jgi:hypothetical protein